MTFNTHGLVSCKHVGDLLEVALGGAFNQEGAYEYENCVTNFLNETHGKSCSILVDMEGVEGATPGAWKAVAKSNLMLERSDNLVWLIVVCDSSVIKYSLKKVITSELKSKIKLFDKKNTAMDFYLNSNESIIEKKS